MIKLSIQELSMKAGVTRLPKAQTEILMQEFSALTVNVNQLTRIALVYIAVSKFYLTQQAMFDIIQSTIHSIFNCP